MYPEIFASGFIFGMKCHKIQQNQPQAWRWHKPASFPSTSHLWITKHLSCLYRTVTTISELLGQVLGEFLETPPSPPKYHVPKKFSGIPGGSCFKDRLTPHLLELCPAKLLYYDTTCFLGIPLHVLTLVAFALFPWHPKV